MALTGNSRSEPAARLSGKLGWPAAMLVGILAFGLPAICAGDQQSEGSEGDQAVHSGPGGEADDSQDRSDPILNFQPPVNVHGMELSAPRTHGLRLNRAELHPYAGLALQYRSNVFYKTTRVDHASLELVDLGLRFVLPPAGGGNGAKNEETPPWLVLDYGTQFQIFNRFHELNYIEHHGLIGAHLRSADLGVDFTDRLGTRHEPETAEMAVLTVREIQTFYHDLEVGAYAPPPADGTDGGRMGIAATVDQRRHNGTGLNFAEYDAFGLNLAYEDSRLTAPLGGDPLTFKLSLKGVSFPARVLNNFVLYQGVVKSGGVLSSGPADPWDVEFAVGAAVIDVQTFRTFTGEKRRDALLPVAAVQIDGILNSKQYLHFRLRIAHEPDLSFRANYLQRTTVAAQLLQRLNDSYEWEARAMQTWEDPSKGPTLSQFELLAEMRWYKEFPRWYLGRHAPLYLRVETRQVETVDRNVTGVKTFGDTRLTVGWALVL